MIVKELRLRNIEYWFNSQKLQILSNTTQKLYK